MTINQLGMLNDQYEADRLVCNDPSKQWKSDLLVTFLLGLMCGGCLGLALGIWGWRVI